MKLRQSPATVIAVVALVVSLGGTAFAAGAFTGKQKKQVTKIATGVFNRSISGASANRALSSGTADRAETAARAETVAVAPEAAVAARATDVSQAAEATTAKKADEASTAQRVPLADTATRADSVPAATRATSAANANALGGSGLEAFQRSLAGSCSGTSSIVSITPQGAVQCASPVRSFQANPPLGSNTAFDLGNGLELSFSCQQGLEVAFVGWRNAGGGSAALNYFAIHDGKKEALGRAVPPSNPQNIGLVDGVLEGQFIWTTPQAITTIMLHAFFRAGTACEIGGTAVTAAG